MIDEASKRSGDLFRSGWFCAESVLLAIAEARGVNSDLLPKIASGFCAGVARTCRMCGAVSGAVMSIGLFCGRTSPDESVLPLYETVRDFLKQFEDRYGSTNCRDLTGCDLGTDEGQNYFKTNHIKDKCIQITESATAIAGTLIEKRLNEPKAG